MIQIAGIIIYRGAAYLPVVAETDIGQYVQVEPVFCTELTGEGLTQGLTRLIEAGHPRIAALSGADWKRRKDPILSATGVKSWTKLAKEGYSYGVTWDANAVTLVLHEIDDKGRFASGLGRMLTFPPDVPLGTIAEAILEDVRQLQSAQSMPKQ